MKKILWNIDNVKINVPDIYMEEYPEDGKTFKVGFDSKDIAENTGIVQFTFAVQYNGGVILCSDYAVGSDGTISFDLPVGVSCVIDSNIMTVKKKDEPVGEIKAIKISVTNNTPRNVFALQVNPRIIDGKFIISGNSSIKSNESGIIYVPFSYTDKGIPTSSFRLYLRLGYEEMSSLVVTPEEEDVTCTFSYDNILSSYITINNNQRDEINLTLSLPS